MKALIFEIKHFAVHDGDGIRTTVFFKGCPLKCKWCHNPEGISREKELAFYLDKCISCGKCVAACPNGAHVIENGKHIFLRGKCQSCFKCMEVCLNSALVSYGWEATVDDVMKIVLEDRDFYESSGGGVTLSGGECLLQIDFVFELLKRLKEEGINTAVDTSGEAPRNSFEKILPYTDTFLFDIKAFSPKVHRECTGSENSLILENLEYLLSKGASVEIRVPLVPGVNSDELAAIAKHLNKFNVERVKVLPYHDYARSKYVSLGKKDTLPKKLPTEEEIQEAKKLFKSAQ